MKFKNGMKLRRIAIDNSPHITYNVGSYMCESISIVMQNGQMGEVAWAEVKYSTGTTTLVNLANVLNVELLEQVEKGKK